MSQSPPVFPDTRSTILNTRPKTVALKTKGWYEEALSSDAGNIYPGMLLDPRKSDDSVVRAVTFGKKGYSWAKEDALQGHWFSDPFVSGDLVPYFNAQQGDHILALVNAGCPAFVEGADLVSAGDGTLVPNPGVSGGLLYDNTADSTAVATTSSETPFNKSFTFPANFFKAGDVIRIRGLVAAIGVTSTPTLRVKLLITSGALSPVVVTVMDTSTVSVIASDLAEFEATLTIRTVGASGTIVGEGNWTVGTPGTAVETPFALASTTFDTTNTEQVTVTAKWSASSASNTCLLRDLSITIVNRPMEATAVALEALDNSIGSTMAYVVVEQR